MFAMMCEYMDVIDDDEEKRKALEKLYEKTPIEKGSADLHTTIDDREKPGSEGLQSVHEY